MRVHVGDFEVQDEITVSDPCYDPHSYNLGLYLPAVLGTWTAYIDYECEDGSNFDKPAMLYAVHSDYDGSSTAGICSEGQVAVDSGQMCIWSSHDYSNDDVRYDNIADGNDAVSGGGTLSNGHYDKHYLGDYGIACLTFYGDGLYPVEYWKDDGRAYAVKIDFAED